MKQRYVPALFAALLALCFSCGAFAGSGSGTVIRLSLNKSWNGVLFQLNGPGEYESGCPSTWLYFSIDNPFYRSWLAVLMTAKAAQRNVIVGTSGCESAPHAVLPKVEAIELD